MDSSELKELLSELVSAVNQVMQSGEVLSDEFQGEIAKTLSGLMQKIDNSVTQKIPNQSLQPSISPDAELLWVLAGQDPQAFISYLRTFPTDSTRQLLANPQQLNATIVQLQQMMPQGQPSFVDGIPHADLNSSNIWGANYDPSSGKMRVRFQGGSEYEYDGVPQNIFKAFITGNASAKTSGQNKYGRWWKNKNPSLGSAMHQYIKKGGFAYKKLK
jgi:hypothetical protein